MKADRLILLTDVKGLLLDGDLVPRLTLKQVESTLSKIGKGMITKIHAASEAIKLGVGEVVVTSGLEDNPISKSLDGTAGTVITHG